MIYMIQDLFTFREQLGLSAVVRVTHLFEFSVWHLFCLLCFICLSSLSSGQCSPMMSPITMDMFTCRKHFSVLASCMTYHQVCNLNNTTSTTTGAATDYPSGTLEFTSGLSGVRFVRYLVF